MKNILVTLCIIASVLTAQERYSQITIPGATARDLMRIEELGIAADHFGGKLGDAVTLFVSESEQARMTKAGIPFRVDIADWVSYYRTENARRMRTAKVTGTDTVKYFSFGTKGGHYTMKEMLDQLKFMKQVYSHLITDTMVIGKSYENRNIIAVRISAVPESTKAAAPEVLYTGVHHAREPMGCTGLIYYMWWLLENYQRDPEATYLLDHRQLWFIPIVNPDGYEFNGNGDMWRKNRRPLAGGNYGIDLNRNYGTFTMWNAPNGGSSTTLSSDTYRGPAPFSEPETQVIRNFMAQHSFKTAFNYHTYGNYLIYPWGYSSSESPDSLLFRYWTYDMSGPNRYSNGTDMETVGYSTRGNSDDFMYGDSAKGRTYAMTPEIGTSGFYAMVDEIIPLSKANLLQNKMLAHVAGGYPEVRSFTINGTQGTITILNKGIATLKGFPIFLTTSKGMVTSTLYTKDIASFATQQLSFTVSAANGQPHASGKVTVYLKDSTDLFYRGGMLNDSISFFGGAAVQVFLDSATSTKNWTMGSWAIVPDLLTGNSVYTDSPSGPYSANIDNSMTLTTSVSLSSFESAELRFRTKWSIESTWDFATVEASSDNGTTWTTLRTKYSHKGAGRNAMQPAAAWGYDAYVPGLTWIEQSADLTPYAGKQVKVRFRLRSDGADQRDGWYVDDIRILGYVANPDAVDDVEAVPFDYALQQNFPNPFNPSTVIRFIVKERGPVTLDLFNALGQRVAVMMDQELNAGSYSVNFDARQLSSGVYFYRLRAGAFSDVKRMAVVK